ncbi:LysE family translocator [Calidifontibacillus erzurumensis]|uniref:LysE family translocator n=1 Tax=Calidifontibacillus erzurumensis TaxID=2741433 RepID=A0A8J8K993_9BACI|nr:LysE family translocator [Calidifontibacillus erzurumensis]NSL52836.1 LysE family translocator [Calidifontibacillus erzurumensis]
MDFLSIISFLGIAIVLTVLPGPDNLFTLAQSIAKGTKAGIYTTLGICTGLLVHITAATVGITAVVYQSAFAFTVVKYLGAAYLLFLAFKSFKEKSSFINLENVDALDYKSLYKKGLVTNLLNPKVSLYFMAFIPQFVNYNNGNVSVQMLVYGILFLVQAFVVFSFISIFAGRVGGFLRKNHSLSRRINIIQGSLFAFIGLKIAFSKN